MSKKGPKTSEKSHIFGMIVVTKNYKLKMTPKAEKTESIHPPHFYLDSFTS